MKNCKYDKKVNIAKLTAYGAVYVEGARGVLPYISYIVM